ncbi:MAG: hypothetical protein ACLQBJ_17010 [Bryobacteraceae bacterium]
MRTTEWIVTAGLFIAVSTFCRAQVLSPPEILDLDLRELQQKHLAELKSVAVAVASHQFPYHFYFSRKLDLSEEQERSSDQRSIQFARFQNRIVLQITANYFAAYSGELLSKEDRAHKTIDDVMLPILRVEVPVMQQEQAIDSFALEVSHHVRKKTIGVVTERVENVVLVIPREAAVRLVSASTAAGQQAAFQQASIFLNGQPLALWPHAGAAAVAAGVAPPPPPPPAAKTAPVLTSAPALPAVTAPTAVQQDTSADALKNLQATWQETIDRIVRDMDAPARFVGYAPPSFIGFHKGVYLQLSLTTPLPATAAGSRYRLAAMAFDDHIARLVRPLMAYFKDDPKFDGIDFSTSIRLEGAPAGAGAAVAVEYIFGMPSLRCYEQYDCTGQQLINSGFILINGERVGLDLQSAEAPALR